MSDLPVLKSGLYLRTALNIEAPAPAHGRYVPSRNERIVALGKDYGSRIARMVSYHESFHAILNGSTTFGNAMIFAGALHDAGYEGFEQLIDAMISDALATHETYATLSAIYAAVGGGFDRGLIEAYPDYLPLFDSMASELDLHSRPYIASVCIESIARVSMQTDILQKWSERSPEQWSLMDWSPDQTPDLRFRSLLRRDIIADAVSAVGKVIAGSHEPFAVLAQRGRTSQETIDRVRASSTQAQDLVSQTAFQVFASALAGQGISAPQFDEQRRAARDIARAVTGFAGDRLKTEFHVPDDLEEDRQAVVVDFRRERVDIRATGQPAAIAWLEEVDSAVALSFSDRSGEAAYVQLVALPVGKARHIYAFTDVRRLPDEDTAFLTGVRRRLAPAAGRPSGLVELIRIRQPRDLDLWAGAGIFVHGVICASVLYSGRWMGQWLSREESRVSSLSVLVDIDPFHLMRHLARDTELMITRASVRMDEPAFSEVVEICVIVAADRPNVVHFTPCSRPVFDAVVDFVSRELPGTRVGFDLNGGQMEILARAASHALREEPVFGFDFW